MLNHKSILGDHHGGDGEDDDDGLRVKDSSRDLKENQGLRSSLLKIRHNLIELLLLPGPEMMEKIK